MDYLLLLNKLTDERKSYGYFIEDNATAHTAKLSTREINAAFDDIIVHFDLLLPRFPDLNPCDFYLWQNLKG